MKLRPNRKPKRKQSSDPRVYKRATTKEEGIERRRKAMELRIKGYSYAEISKLLGFTECTVFKYIKEQLEEHNRLMFENVQLYRRLESLRLDRMLKGIIDRATQGIPMLNEEGNPVLDKEGNPVFVTDLKAIDRVLKIMERRSKFFGLDEPIQSIIKGDPDAPLSLQVQDAEARKVLSKLEDIVSRIGSEQI